MLQIYTFFWKRIHQSTVFFLIIDEKYIWLIKLLIIISSQLDSDA